MHGGGGTTKEINDQQWQNQKSLYNIPDGVYIAPRAPTDEWNMWFKPGMETLFNKIIAGAVLFDGVDPDQVYLLGYSAGGDGVWQMGPRMVDTWAAAAMMAGHPNGRSMLNLRNLPFMIWVGEFDSDYKRNDACQEKANELKKLHNNDPKGYIYSFHKVKGKGHWMDLEDQAAIGWMSKYKLNKYPKRIVWKQEHEFPTKYFYYVSVPDEEIEEGSVLILEYTKNEDGSTTFNIERSDYYSITIYIDPEVIDISKPIIVTYEGEELFNGTVSLSKDVAFDLARNRISIPYILPAKIDVSLE